MILRTCSGRWKAFSWMLAAFALAAAAPAQRGNRAANAAADPAKPPAALIPVTDPLVVQRCGICHVADAKGNLSRISAIRTTPEGWEEAIKRMVRLNKLQLEPDEARHILRYLSDTHGLAPEEAAQIEYFNEHRMIDEKMPDAETQHACASCHALARPLSWRRTPDDWDLLKNMHLAFFPSIEGSFRGGGAGGGGGAAAPAASPAADGAAPAAPRQAVDVALAWIKKSTPLETPEWSAWSAMSLQPKLAGTWMITGEMPGKGKFFGQMKIDAKADGNFSTHSTVNFVSGAKWAGEGTSLIYTGYAWRGRETGAAEIAGIDAPHGLREVMMVSRDQSEITGRWFWGTYEEFGMDVTMHRLTPAPMVEGTDISALKTGTADATVRLFGANLPTTLTPADISLGAGVTVSKVLSSTPDMVTVTASVDAKATPGLRLISVGSATIPAAYAVYDKMDFLKVTPTTSLAHLGSEPHAKGYMQFEAIAYGFGPDGKPNTADDIPLGPVPASWKMEEFVASYGDDDIQFVGKLDPATGFFTPASDGPNPKRKSMRNNYGDVWSVATYTPPGESKPLIGRSYLIVAVPQYVDWDQPEVGQ